MLVLWICFIISELRSSGFYGFSTFDHNQRVNGGEARQWRVKAKFMCRVHSKAYTNWLIGWETSDVHITLLYLGVVVIERWCCADN